MNEEFKIEHEEEIIDQNGNRIKKCIYAKNIECFISCIKKYNNNNIYIEGEYYTDDNFTDLLFTEKREYNQDGSYTKRTILSKPKDGCLSVIQKYDEKNRLLEEN